MKKSLILGVALVGTLLASCDKDQSDSKMSFKIPTANLITSLDSGETYMNTSTYAFDLNLTKGLAVIGCDNLVVNNNSLSFTTDEKTFLTNGYWIVVDNPTGTVTGNSTLQLKNSYFSANPYYNFNFTYVPGYVTQPTFERLVVSQYNLGDEYRVVTFNTDAFYMGETKTVYPSMDGSGTVNNYTSTEMTYRVVMNIQKQTADLIIYNAKFSASEREPVKVAIIAKDLTVKLNNGAYTIEGSNIIPEVVEGGASTPYPNFIFNSINFTTTNSTLTECSISYEVAGMYKGSFTGSYLAVDPQKSQQ